jgi:hypothetical protein
MYTLPHTDTHTLTHKCTQILHHAHTYLSHAHTHFPHTRAPLQTHIHAHVPRTPHIRINHAHGLHAHAPNAPSSQASVYIVQLFPILPLAIYMEGYCDRDAPSVDTC